tara:strand:- start:238 stop:735 length:498 start_codon:yes stop_codon:yes gene_type:complete
MTVIEIAQLTTGIATLIVAIILLWQTGLSRKDSDIDLTYKSLNTLMNRFGVIYKDEKFRKIYLNRFKSKNKLNEDEYVALDFFWRQHIAQVGTDYRLGRANRDKVYYEMAYGFILDCDLACEWYKVEGRKLLEYSSAKNKEKQINFLTGIADELYEKFTGKKINL